MRRHVVETAQRAFGQRACGTVASSRAIVASPPWPAPPTIPKNIAVPRIPLVAPIASTYQSPSLTSIHSATIPDYPDHPNDVYSDISSSILLDALRAHDFTSTDSSPSHIAMPVSHRDMKIALNALDVVLCLRSRDPYYANAVPPRAWSHLVAWAGQVRPRSEGDFGSLRDALLEDFVECLDLRMRDGDDGIRHAYRQAAYSIFQLTLAENDHGSPPITISHQQALNIFHILTPSVPAPDCSTAMMVRVVEAMVSDRHFAVHVPFLRAVYPFLLTSLEKSADTPNSFTSLRGRAVWAAFGVVRRLLSPGKGSDGRCLPVPARCTSLALEIFAALCSAGCIPYYMASVAYQAISRLVNSPTNSENEASTLNLATMQVLTLACFKWSWHSRALDVLEALPRARGFFQSLEAGLLRMRTPPLGKVKHFPGLPSEIAHLAQIIIQNALYFPTRKDFNFASSIIMAYSRYLSVHPTTPHLPTPLIWTYYLASAAFPSASATAHVFRALSDAIGNDPTLHPIPSTIASNLLRHHFTAKCSESRSLISSVLKSDHTRDSLDPDFVLQVAKLGYVDLAYQFWTKAKAKHSGVSHLLICGDSRIVSEIVRVCSVQPDTRRPLELSGGFSTSVEGEGQITPESFASMALEEFKRIRLGRSPELSVADLQILDLCDKLRETVDRMDTTSATTSRQARTTLGAPTLTSLVRTEEALKVAQRSGSRSEMREAALKALALISESAIAQPRSFCRLAVSVALKAGDVELASNIWQTAGPRLEMKTHRFNDTLRDDLVHELRQAMRLQKMPRAACVKALKALGSSTNHYDVRKR